MFSSCIFRVFALCLIPLVGASFVTAAGLGIHADTLATEFSAQGRLAPAPSGIEDLKFSELYVMPVGPRGMELTPKAAALAGKQVRMLGYMVHQSKPSPGVALFAPYTLSTNETEEAFCDDLPATVVSVLVPKYADLAVPYTPGPLLLTGRFETSPHAESDGRVSFLRLVLDEEENLAPSPSPSAAPTRPRSVRRHH